MAADGLSNPEIAQALFVTVRTVESHLGHVYRKLDITGREGLGPRLVAAAPVNATERHQ
jgi:DNA-binding CsgD family transcriptional regulator